MPRFEFDRGGDRSFRFDEAALAEGEYAVPATAEEFARNVIYAICRASVAPAVGRRMYERCMRGLAFGSTARLGFRHPGKADAIDLIWRERDRLFDEYRATSDKIAYLAALPWVGPVTKQFLAHRLRCTAHEDRTAA